MVAGGKEAGRRGTVAADGEGEGETRTSLGEEQKRGQEAREEGVV